MGGLPERLVTALFIILTVLWIGFFLVGCSTSSVMSAENLRAALDECHEMKLWILVYQRPDRSVMDVRCIPDPDQVNEYVTLRPKMPMKLIRPFYDVEQLPKGYYEQQ